MRLELLPTQLRQFLAHSVQSSFGDIISLDSSKIENCFCQLRLSSKRAAEKKLMAFEYDKGLSEVF